MTVCSQVNCFCGFKDARPKQNLQASRSRLPCRSRALLILNGQRAQEKSSGLRFLQLLFKFWHNKMFAFNIFIEIVYMSYPGFFCSLVIGHQSDSECATFSKKEKP